MNSKVFDKAKPIIGVLQLLPLPGSLGWKGRIDQVIARAEQEASALATGGVDGILVENTFDSPYPQQRMDVAGAIAMGLIIRRIMHFTHLPIGVSVLRNDPETALAIAMNVGAKFIRVNVLTGVAVSDSGLIEGRFAQLQAYQQQLQSSQISVFADIALERQLYAANHNAKEQNWYALARQALDIGRADGLILTDTGLSPQAIQQLASVVDSPVFMDYTGGIADAAPYLQASSGLVVANPLKKSSLSGPDMPPTVDLTKVEELMSLAEWVRSTDTEKTIV